MQLLYSSQPLHLCGLPISNFLFLQHPCSKHEDMYTTNLGHRGNRLNDRCLGRIRPWKCFSFWSYFLFQNMQEYTVLIQTFTHYLLWVNSSGLLPRLSPHWLTLLLSLRNRAVSFLKKTGCFFLIMIWNLPLLYTNSSYYTMAVAVSSSNQW